MSRHLRALRSALLLAATVALAAGELRADAFALLPVRRGVRQPAATASVERAAAGELAARGALIDAERTRTALRRLRLRAAEGASAAQLREVAQGLGADWLLAVAVHDALEDGIPDLTLSARLYEGRSGEVAWAGSVGRSGLDRGRLLGLGTIFDLQSLVPIAVADLLAPILSGEIGRARPAERRSGRRESAGPLALVPFSVVAVDEGVEVASAATETLRALLDADGVALAQPGCVTAALRGPAGVRWGELGVASRDKLRADCGAERLVTGTVERWEIAGSSRAPEPIVAVAVRLVDAASGEILWTGSLESRGWEREGWFGAGRVYSRGEHLRRLLERIERRMLAANPAVKVMKGSS